MLKESESTAQGPTRQPQAGPDRGRAVPRQAGRRGRGTARLCVQSTRACAAWASYRTTITLLLERFKIRIRQAREGRVADLKAMAEQIAKMAGITIEAAATPEGHLYGLVGPAEIAKGLRGKNLPVDAEMVRVEGAIKEAGLYGVKLNLGYDIETEVKVAVIAVQGREPPRPDSTASRPGVPLSRPASGPYPRRARPGCCRGSALTGRFCMAADKELLDRLPPQNREAEQSVLGAMLARQCLHQRPAATAAQGRLLHRLPSEGLRDHHQPA